MVGNDPYGATQNYPGDQNESPADVAPASPDVATELGMTRNAVIVARSKVLRKLRELAGEFLD